MVSVTNRTVRFERYLVMHAIATWTEAVTKSNFLVIFPCHLFMSLWTWGIRNRQGFEIIVKLQRQGEAKKQCRIRLLGHV